MENVSRGLLLGALLLEPAEGWRGSAAHARGAVRSAHARAPPICAADAGPSAAAPARRGGAARAGGDGPSSWLRAPSDMDDSRRRESELEAWLTSHGVYLAATSSWGAAPHPLGIASQTKDQDLQPSGRGLLATRGVRQGDALFRVPEKVCITRRNAVAVLGADIATPALGEHETLALLLMRERALGAASFWAPYLNVLPSTAAEVGASFIWSDAELALLQGSAALNEAREFAARLRTSYSELAAPGGPIDTMAARALAPADAMSFEQFEWAMAVLFSRAINMREMDALVLAPYADLLNHSPGSNAIFEAEKPWASDGYEIVCYADRMYGQMEQVYLSYGKRSNQELLLLYGFVIDRNPFDEVVLRVSLDPDATPRYAEKSAFLRRGGRSDALSFPLRVDRFPDELIQFTRFACMGPEEGALETADYTRPLSVANEEAARTAVVDACRAALAAYPRSLDEDRRLLADKGARALLGGRGYAALRLCMNEKAILERAIRAVNALAW